VSLSVLQFSVVKNLLTKSLAGFALAIVLLAPLHMKAQEPASSQPGNAHLSSPESASPQANQEEEDENKAYLQSPTVRALGAKMGMNPKQAATSFTVLNFVILAVLVGWFLVRSLPKVFLNRNKVIQKHLVEARTATEEANARMSSVEARLSKLDEQIAAMRAQAEKDSIQDEQRIKAGVEEEKQKILAAAEQEIAAATTQAQRQIQQYAAELAIDQAAKKLVVTAETDRLLIQNFARRLTGEDSTEGHN
jgi:F-type H+-transporting ATPase subunit b